jgi:hypothetical protein
MDEDDVKQFSAKLDGLVGTKESIKVKLLHPIGDLATKLFLSILILWSALNQYDY